MKRLWTPAWITRHVITVGLVAGFLALGRWQVSRAASGNALSWAYAIEWPIFAGFVVFLWFREVRHTLRPEHPIESGASAQIPQTGAAPAPPSGPGIRRPVRSVRTPVTTPTDDDPPLSAYNDYLSWLNANPGARPGDYPGPGR